MAGCIYIIGAGYISHYHAAAISKLLSPERISLAVATPSEKSLASFMAKFPHARGFRDAREMLAEKASPDDIVIVSTPVSVHKELTLLALNSCRHVLCEKPLGMNREEAFEMLRAARRAKRVLGCCSTRYLGTLTGEEVKRLLRNNALGEVYHVTFVNRARRGRQGIEDPPLKSWFLERAQAGGGVLMDMGPYDISTLNDLLQPIRFEAVDAWTATPATELHLPEGAVNDVEQHFGASLRYHLADGRVLPVDYERAACTHGAERTIVEVEGTTGAVRWDWMDWRGDGVIVRSCDDHGKPAEESRRLGTEQRLGFQDRPLCYFYEHLQGRPSLAVVNEQALFNFCCVQAIYACAASGEKQTVSMKEMRD